MQVEKDPSPHWSKAESHPDVDLEKAPCVTESNMTTKDCATKQLEEDSNISLLLCEETIPGSPAPDNLGEAVKVPKPRLTRNLEMPFVSAPSLNVDQAPKDHLVHKGKIKFT